MLYLIATPIGNLNDITLRALDILREVDYVASEDTRKTGLLLKHFDIHKPQIAFHEHNEQRAGEQIERLLQEGKSIAMVTDAGTPGISDPGFTLVRRAINANLKYTMIPGPSAFVMALVLSGLPVHSFTFRGFPPRKSVGRQKFLEIDKDAPHTLVFYESPYRVEGFLQDALTILGDREAALAHDLTKMFESVERGSLSNLIESVKQKKLKGEFIVVIAGTSKEKEKDRGNRLSRYASKQAMEEGEEDETIEEDEDESEDGDEPGENDDLVEDEEEIQRQAGLEE